MSWITFPGLRSGHSAGGGAHDHVSIWKTEKMNFECWLRVLKDSNQVLKTKKHHKKRKSRLKRQDAKTQEIECFNHV